MFLTRMSPVPQVPGWHDGFSWWSLAGYAVSTVGIFLFNNIVIVPLYKRCKDK